MPRGVVQPSLISDAQDVTTFEPSRPDSVLDVLLLLFAQLWYSHSSGALPALAASEIDVDAAAATGFEPVLGFDVIVGRQADRLAPELGGLVVLAVSFVGIATLFSQ